MGSWIWHFNLALILHETDTLVIPSIWTKLRIINRLLKAEIMENSLHLEVCKKRLPIYSTRKKKYVKYSLPCYIRSHITFCDLNSISCQVAQIHLSKCTVLVCINSNEYFIVYQINRITWVVWLLFQLICS